MTKIQLRHDTAANFASENPILLAGEAAVEMDTNKIKIGDGTTAYNSLGYFSGNVDLSAYYTKAETDTLLDSKADSSDIPDVTHMVTDNTSQTISGTKTFTSSITVVGNQTITAKYNTNTNQRTSLNTNSSRAWLAMVTTDNAAGEIGVAGSASSRKMYIQAPTGSSDLYINNSADGGSLPATTVTIFGTNINTKRGSNRYTNLDSGNIDTYALTSSTGVSSTNIRTITKLTQAEYDALVQAGTVDANTFYVIVAASGS